LLASIDEQDADAEYTAILQALVTRDRLEFPCDLPPRAFANRR
jgi:hypothetical protein